jgi:hypothetical protein
MERQEVRLCTDILSDVLTFLHLRRRDCDDKRHDAVARDAITADHGGSAAEGGDDSSGHDNSESRDADFASRDAGFILRDVGVVAEELLHPLVQSILVMDRQSKSAAVVSLFYIFFSAKVILPFLGKN